MFLPIKEKLKSGQTYIDILIALGILLVLSASVFALVTTAFDIVSYSRARITARHLASEKIELIRNLPYSSAGTVGGIPAGPLSQEENIQKNGLNYFVKTTIVYIDDPFDHLAPQDTLPTDYKRVRVDVSWEGLSASEKNPITLITDIAPRGTETAEGTGTLSILVFDANAEPLPQADVQITANEINPAVNLNLKTSDDGRIILPGSPVCTSCYQITATKENCSTEKTYSSQEIANPAKAHQSILEGRLTEISFAIDKLGSLQLLSTNNREAGFQPMPNQTFILKGEKKLGFDINDDPVYKYEEQFTTDELGRITIENLEWDNYHLFPHDGSNWDIAGANPPMPIKLLPDQQLQASFALTPASSYNLLTVFIDNADNPISSVSARLFDTSGFEATASSGSVPFPDFGQIFFPNLESKTYSLEASVSGFLNFSGNISVTGKNRETLTLNND